MARCARSWRVQLENSPRLSLLPDARVSQTLGLMGRPASTKLTPDVAAEICERTASVAVVEGSITSLGSEYALSLQARNCRTGEVLAQEQARAARKGGRLQGAGAKWQNDSGLGPENRCRRVEKEPYFSAEITTSSLEAWRSYNTGVNVSMHTGIADGSQLTPEAGGRTRPHICDGSCLPGPEL